MSIVIDTPFSVGLLSREQLESFTKSKLQECCKVLELKGYSKSTKLELVDKVYNASDVMRKGIMSQDRLVVERKESEFLKKQAEILQDANSTRALNKNFVCNVLDKNIKSKLRKTNLQPTSEQVAEVLITACRNWGYADITITKTCTGQLRELFSMPEMIEKYGIDRLNAVRDAWNKLVWSGNWLQCDKETLRIKQFASQAEKHFDNPESIVNWAIATLESEKTHPYIKGLALSIVSGRRQSEIFGSTKFSHSEYGVLAEGLVKGQDGNCNTTEIVLLCDIDLFLKSIEELESKGKRGMTVKQVNDNVAREVSRMFPTELKLQGIEKYKDTRDFYAGQALTLFREVGANLPNVCVQTVMGHKSASSTNYYAKYSMPAIASLKPTFERYSQNLSKVNCF